MSSAISSCIDARIDVSGVRSSWLTIEMNCDFRRSSSRAIVTSEPRPIRYDVCPFWPRSAITVHAITWRAPLLPTQIRSSLTGSVDAASRGMPSRISARSLVEEERHFPERTARRPPTSTRRTALRTRG